MVHGQALEAPFQLVTVEDRFAGIDHPRLVSGLDLGFRQPPWSALRLAVAAADEDPRMPCASRYIRGWQAMVSDSNAGWSPCCALTTRSGSMPPHPGDRIRVLYRVRVPIKPETIDLLVMARFRSREGACRH
jgi:hypothetical protein